MSKASKASKKKPAMDVAVFENLVGTEAKWRTTRELVDLLDQAEFWSSNFLGTAIFRAKAAFIHNKIRQVKDEDGWPTWASVERITEDGTTQRLYKHESQFTMDDYRQVINYWRGVASHARAMWVGYERRARERFGENAKGQDPESN